MRSVAKAIEPIRNLGTWRDKAGGYGIQEPFGMRYIERIDGDFYNVVGLPVGTIWAKLKELGAV